MQALTVHPCRGRSQGGFLERGSLFGGLHTGPLRALYGLHAEGKFRKNGAVPDESLKPVGPQLGHFRAYKS